MSAISSLGYVFFLSYYPFWNVYICDIFMFQDRIVPPDPITPQEKYQTLTRLDQIIQHRLVTNDLPPKMRKLRISELNGCTASFKSYQMLEGILCAA